MMPREVFRASLPARGPALCCAGSRPGKHRPRRARRI